jgi:hypothetical protein
LVFLKEKDHSGNQRVDERLILRLIIRKQGEKFWTGWLRLQTDLDTYEHGNEF